MGIKYHLPITANDKKNAAENLDEVFECIKDAKVFLDATYNILDGADPEVVLPLMKALGEVKAALYDEAVWGKLVTVNRAILGLKTT